MVSNFDDLKIAASYGSWMVTSDQRAGGKSQAAMRPVEGGANGSRGALEVTGEIVPGASFRWAGVLFYPGSSPADAVNLSSKRTVSFWAKGDGKNYSIAIQTEANAGQVPGMQSFVAGTDWKQYSFPLSSFQHRWPRLNGNWLCPRTRGGEIRVPDRRAANQVIDGGRNYHVNRKAREPRPTDLGI